MKAAPKTAACNPVAQRTAWLDAVAEYFDWLNEEELMAGASGNQQYADAMARASSELGCLLVKHKIYREMKAANAPAHRPEREQPKT